MPFDSEVTKPGRGVAYFLELSFDGFATVTARWGTHSGKLDGANDYEARIIGLGRLERALGQSHIAAASTLDVVLDNTDELLDFLFDTPENALKARLRFSIAIWDPSASAPSFESKRLLEGGFSGFPRRDDAVVRATIADDVLNFLDQPVESPSLQDWRDVDSASPLRNGTKFHFAVSPETRAPFSFGDDWVRCIPVGTSENPTTDKYAVLVCATRGGDARSERNYQGHGAGLHPWAERRASATLGGAAEGVEIHARHRPELDHLGGEKVAGHHDRRRRLLHPVPGD